MSNDTLSASTDYIDAYVDNTGTMFFSDASALVHSTGESINSPSSPIDAQLVISDVVGTVDYSSGIYFSWAITAQLKFRAIAAGVSFTNCQTSTFTINISGDHAAGATSSSFTIPSLSGTACNSHGSEINTKLGLGFSGATLNLTKWGAENTATSLPLTGSP